MRTSADSYRSRNEPDAMRVGMRPECQWVGGGVGTRGASRCETWETRPPTSHRRAKAQSGRPGRSGANPLGQDAMRGTGVATAEKFGYDAYPPITPHGAHGFEAIARTSSANRHLFNFRPSHRSTVTPHPETETTPHRQESTHIRAATLCIRNRDRNRKAAMTSTARHRVAVRAASQHVTRLPRDRRLSTGRMAEFVAHGPIACGLVGAGGRRGGPPNILGRTGARNPRPSDGMGSVY